jgi:hypothetical protein
VECLGKVRIREGRLIFKYAAVKEERGIETRAVPFHSRGEWK